MGWAFENDAVQFRDETPGNGLNLATYLDILPRSNIIIVRMPAKKTELLQGTLDLLILKTLAQQPLHGYGIAQRILVTSREILQVQQGSLYPALHRLERQGLLKSEWK